MGQSNRIIFVIASITIIFIFQNCSPSAQFQDQSLETPAPFAQGPQEEQTPTTGTPTAEFCTAPNGQSVRVGASIKAYTISAGTCSTTCQNSYETVTCLKSGYFSKNISATCKPSGDACTKVGIEVSTTVNNGYSSTTYSFNETPLKIQDVSRFQACDSDNARCSRSGNVVRVENMAPTGSARAYTQFYFSRFPSRVDIRIKGSGNVLYNPAFYWLYSDGSSDASNERGTLPFLRPVTDSQVCVGASAHYYNNVDVAYYCNLPN